MKDDYIDKYDMPITKPPSTVDELDDVNQPPHYKLWGSTEAIDIIRGALSEEEFMGYLKGNILKYRLRAGKKNNAEKDIAKATWYEGEVKAYGCKDKASS